MAASSKNQTAVYTGYLVSFSYTPHGKNGIESTQLIFTNKTFNYEGYVALINNHAYNVTYDSNDPNQALEIKEIEP